MDRLKKELEEWREKARELRTTVDTLRAQYIYKDSKLLAHVVYFAKPIKTSLWVIWTE